MSELDVRQADDEGRQHDLPDRSSAGAGRARKITSCVGVSAPTPWIIPTTNAEALP